MTDYFTIPLFKMHSTCCHAKVYPHTGFYVNNEGHIERIINTFHCIRCGKPTCGIFEDSVGKVVG